MNKVTGKALSLVLSLALVVSSFSVSLASASTRTTDGIVDDTDEDSIYLVNGGTDDAARSLELNTYINEVVQTKTRDEVDDVKVDAISHVSGDSLVTLKTESDGDDAFLKLKSKSVKGTEVISILYKGTYTDDDGNEYTVKARKNFTVYVYDEGQPILGNVTSDLETGEGLDDFTTLAQTRGSLKDLGLYVAKRASTTSAVVAFAPIYLTTNKNGVDALSDAVKDSAYYIEVTSGESDAHLVDSGSQWLGNAQDVTKANATAASYLTKFDDTSDATTQLQLISGKTGSLTVNGTVTATKDASNTNVTLTLKKLTGTGAVSSDSSDKYTFKTKVDKKIDVAQAIANDSADSPSPSAFTVKKANGKTRLIGVYDLATSDGATDATTRKALDVTDTELVFPTTTTSVDVGDDDDTVNVKKISGTVGSLTIAEKAHVGSIDIDDGHIEVSGKVGDITTDNDHGGTGAVLVKSGASVGNIETKDAGSTADVEVDGGTTGTIDSKGTVTLDATDSDDPVVTGAVTAIDAVIYSDEAKVTVASLKAKDANGNLAIEGDNVTIGKIDLDSRETTLQLGDDSEDDEAFVGTIPSIANATNATIKTSNEDTVATVQGDVDVDTVDLDSDTQITFSGSLTADTIEGDGVLAIGAGKLYVSSSVSSTTLKLTDATLAVGTTVFKADSDASVDEDDFTGYGFTLAKTSGNTVDTFKIASLSFAGLQITGPSSEIVLGNSATYTASAYPGGTSIPSGYTVEWDLDGGSSDVFDLTTNGNSATVKVNSIDATFPSENKTTLTATLYDEDGYEDDDYQAATFDISAVTTPSVTYKSDTTGTVNLKVGASYQFKITSTDGSTPNFVVAGNSGAKVTATSKSGNDWFFKVTALKTGDYGVYVNNGARVAVLHITSDAKLDTTAVTIKAGSTYQFKVTSSAKPVFGLGSSAAVLTSSSASGNNYFYKVKAAGKAGDKVGVYVDGSRAAVITVG